MQRRNFTRLSDTLLHYWHFAAIWGNAQCILLLVKCFGRDVSLTWFQTFLPTIIFCIYYLISYLIHVIIEYKCK
jgi:hypothetical protein